MEDHQLSVDGTAEYLGLSVTLSISGLPIQYTSIETLGWGMGWSNEVGAIYWSV